MRLGDLEVGDRFYFRGCWNTDPGVYTVTEIDDGYVTTEEIEGVWFPNVTVEKAEDDSASVC